MFRALELTESPAELAVQDRREYRRLLGLTFVLFFLIAAVSRLLPKAWRPLASRDGSAESVYAEAMRSAYTVVPFVFMR
jgi:hypothetical protein